MTVARPKSAGAGRTWRVPGGDHRFGQSRRDPSTYGRWRPAWATRWPAPWRAG